MLLESLLLLFALKELQEGLVFFEGPLKLVLLGPGLGGEHAISGVPLHNHLHVRLCLYESGCHTGQSLVEGLSPVEDLPLTQQTDKVVRGVVVFEGQEDTNGWLNR